MVLLQSWRESFLFFKSENLKLLLLVTLRIIYQSYLFFLPVFVLFFLLLFFGFMPPTVLATLVFIMVLVARPSVKRKSVDYFIDYIFHFIVWFFAVRFFVVLFSWFALKNIVFSTEYTAIIFPVEVFLLLFWLDARCTVKDIGISFLRAVKMFLLNLPFCLFSFTVPFFLFSYLSYIIPMVLFNFLEFIIYMFYICLFTNFYVKRLHDQFYLYFKV